MDTKQDKSILEEVEQQQEGPWEGYVDWRNRPAIRGRHGGMLPASFALGVEVLENLAFLANASNLVIYMSEIMHFSLSKSANSVTNFMGTAFLLALLGGFLSDTFFTTFHIFLISALVEFLGLVILTTQANASSLKPPSCSHPSSFEAPCHEVKGGKAAMLFTGLYLVALGVGGIKGSLPPHGAEQLDQSTPHGRKQRSTFFNYFVFCLSFGGLIATTLVVWIEDNKGWQWGFGIATITILLSIPLFLAGSPFYRNKIPSGSPLTTIFKVLLSSTLSIFMEKNPSNATVRSMSTSPSPGPSLSKVDERETPKFAVTETPTKTLKFANRASSSSSMENPQIPTKTLIKFLQCSQTQIEEVKSVLKILPILASTIMLNCCLAQLSTFSVHQASTMDTSIGNFNVPPASLPVFPIVFVLLLAPIYDHLIIPFARKATRNEMGITHLQRIGIGLFLSVIAMAVAAMVEIKRNRVASDLGLLNSPDPLPISCFWIAFQYLFLGSADLFTLAGLLEFFFTEAPVGMRSLATSLSWASLAMGYYLSTVIVNIVNSVTGDSGRRPWLAGANLNEYHLERFYWLMCVLSGVNFLQYLFWACRYRYRSSSSFDQ